METYKFNILINEKLLIILKVLYNLQIHSNNHCNSGWQNNLRNCLNL